MSRFRRVWFTTPLGALPIGAGGARGWHQTLLDNLIIALSGFQNSEATDGLRDVSSTAALISHRISVHVVAQDAGTASAMNCSREDGGMHSA